MVGYCKGILQEGLCLGRVTEAKYFFGNIHPNWPPSSWHSDGELGWGRMKVLRPLSQWRSNWWSMLIEEKGIVLITKWRTRLFGRKKHKKTGHMSILFFIFLMFFSLSFGSSSMLCMNVWVGGVCVVFQCKIQWFGQQMRWRVYSAPGTGLNKLQPVWCWLFSLRIG